MKEIFKEGDRVFHIQYGWGKVIRQVSENIFLVIYATENLIEGQFVNQYTERMSRFDLLSFTEYTLQGFSQERPITLPKVGELCLVRDFNDDTWLVREFAEYRHGLFICQAVHGQGEVEWKYMKRIKILD